MRLRLLTPPIAEPLTLDEAKAHLRVDGTEEDAYISALITAAREMVENYTNRQLMEATFEGICDDLGDITLPKPPFRELISIQYTTSGDVLATLAAENHTYLEGSEPAVVKVKKPQDYKEAENGVKVTFKAGYTTVPASLKAAMQLLVGHLYENREEVTMAVTANQLPKASEYLMNPYRVFQF
jgi:uncharacterized phiE125 gp8 family phage protein